MLEQFDFTKTPWTVEIRDSKEEEAYEYVIHLSDESRKWDSWGWPGIHRIIVYGSGTGQGYLQEDQHKEALANVRLMAQAPRLLELLLSLAQHTDGYSETEEFYTEVLPLIKGERPDIQTEV